MHGVFLLLGILWCMPAFGLGEKIIESLVRSDFVFARAKTHVPFMPIGYLYYKHQEDLEVGELCEEPDACDFSYDNIQQALAVPAWVGQRNMLILGQTIDADRVKFRGETLRNDSVGGILGWAAQPQPHIQVGAFAYLYQTLEKEDALEQPGGNIVGAVVRIEHRNPGFHSYWGGVRIEDNQQLIYLPYVGFDWNIGSHWAVSGLLPWPAVTYAPTEHYLFRLGASLSGSHWAAERQEQVITNDFYKWDLGFSYERRLRNMLWGEVSVGYSGLGSIQMESDGDVMFESSLSDKPFIKFAINIRPAAP